jgi:hypothetical protein
VSFCRIESTSKHRQTGTLQYFVRESKHAQSQSVLAIDHMHSPHHRRLRCSSEAWVRQCDE